MSTPTNTINGSALARGDIPPSGASRSGPKLHGVIMVEATGGRACSVSGVNAQDINDKALCLLASALGVFELVAEAGTDSSEGNAIWAGVYTLRQGLALLRHLSCQPSNLIASDAAASDVEGNAA